ncbi:hypothetical protein DFH08DRAFT_961447 [Mycena albidolilacea]|uniref:Uncharacterized protein n=1 Tax=Mycena albidolilacea TaxID=1033008 RepID=A0AAD7ESG9_9AGAR|nr:hypothetical protein DFH08DRAFT_961447 [Mycena albidolilacea]
MLALRRSKAQKDQLKAARTKSTPLGRSDTPDDENTAHLAVPTKSVSKRPKTRSSSTNSALIQQITDLTSSLDRAAQENVDLKSVIADLEGSNQAQASILEKLDRQLESLRSRLAQSTAAHSSCHLHLSTALTDLSLERDTLQKSHKRIRCLELDKKKALIAKRSDAKASAAALSTVNSYTDTQSHLVAFLTGENHRLEALLLTKTTTAAEAMKKLQMQRNAW